MIEKAPLRFHPYLKTVIWGGDKICRYKGIAQPEPNIGESWEISAVPGHESVVAEGTYKGLKLTELIDRFAESLLGERVIRKYGANFPLLIKIIDANDNLSVQVHPDDALAKKRHGSLGKTEMWYIIDAEKDAKIYAGLKVAMTPQEYERRVEADTFAETLAVHDARPGDVFFLPAGRVHAIGAGNLLAEIQENSDITYRIYDYGRRDKEGNPRELHTALAKDAIDYTVYPDYKNAPLDDDDKDCEIVRCDHFATRRILLRGDKCLEFEGDSFTVMICVDGEAELKYDAGTTTVRAGQTLLLPSSLRRVDLKGEATLLVSQS